MTGNAKLSTDHGTLTVRVPFSLKKRGGRKLVIAPDGAPWSPLRARIDNTMVKAIARAYRWKRMLENGDFATINDLATAERINPSYLCRILRLALLASAIVETILDARQPTGLQLDQLLRPFPVEWERQREGFKIIV